MPSDKSEPKIGNIVKVAVVAVVTLLGVRLGLTSYFHSTEDGVRAEYAAEAKKKQAAAPKEEAFNGRVKDSMALLVSRGRKDVDPQVAPQAPKELEKPCWQAMPCDYPGGDAGPSSAAADAGAGAAPDDHGLLDAGVPVTGDAGATPDVAADGGRAAASDAGAVKLGADGGAPPKAPLRDGGRPPEPRRP